MTFVEAGSYSTAMPPWHHCKCGKTTKSSANFGYCPKYSTVCSGEYLYSSPGYLVHVMWICVKATPLLPKHAQVLRQLSNTTSGSIIRMKAVQSVKWSEKPLSQVFVSPINPSLRTNSTILTFSAQGFYSFFQV